MKIFSVSQQQKADEFTILNEPILSVDLMERAARACYAWFNANISRQKSICMYCGQGNNGGDGLALARMLKNAGFSVQVVLLEHSTSPTSDFSTNLERAISRNAPLKRVNSANGFAVENADVLVDAVLGSGLKRPLHGFLAEVISALNAAESFKISIDIPTGLFADGNKENNIKTVFKADVTLTFQSPKWSFMFEEFGANAGQFHVLDIGLHPKYLLQTQVNNFFIDEDLAKSLVKKRSIFDHKGTFGHALLIAGSFGKIGAAILATRAALKTGTGLVSSHVPACGIIPMQVANPEIMVEADAGENCIENVNLQKTYSAIGIGPGLGTDAATKKTLLKYLKLCTQPLVVDADALNLLSKKESWAELPKNSILTPHLGELDRMLGSTLRGEAIYEAAQKFTKKHSLILLVKGARTAIYAPNGDVYFNASGCNGMATAGSGDVLTGIITGLLAQGLSPLNAAIAGVFYHGKAGEAAAKMHGNAGMVASDIITNLSIAE